MSLRRRRVRAQRDEIAELCALERADVMRRLRAEALADSVALRAACPPTPAPDPTPTVDGYQLRVRCPRCARPMHHVHTGSVNPDLNALSKAVIACPTCRIVLHLECRLTVPQKALERDRHADAAAEHYANTDLASIAGPSNRAKRERPPCGTPAGYTWHLRHGEDTCDECRRDNADRQRESKRRRQQQAREAC